MTGGGHAEGGQFLAMLKGPRHSWQTGREPNRKLAFLVPLGGVTANLKRNELPPKSNLHYSHY